MVVAAVLFEIVSLDERLPDSEASALYHETATTGELSSDGRCEYSSKLVIFQFWRVVGPNQ